MKYVVPPPLTRQTPGEMRDDLAPVLGLADTLALARVDAVAVDAGLLGGALRVAGAGHD